MPDASGDAPVDVAPDAPIDAPQEPILRITLKLEDLLALAPQDALSSYGRASGIAPFGANGSSWQYTKPSTGHPSDKFELIMPFASLPNVTTPPELAAILEHLGPITLADIASIKVHTKHSAATTTDFTLIAYTKPDGTDDDASWYGRRIHALLQWAASRSAPADTWNEYATSTGTNQIQFWDFRNANVAQGIQPANNYFTLADIKAGPITPAGISGARDYRAEQLQYLAFTTFSSNTAFDGAIDGIELVLNNGKGVNIDLDGDSNVYRTKVSLTQMRARHGNGNSYGIDGTASSSMPYAGATSWRYIKGAGAPADEKLEFHVPFAISDGEDVDALWEPMRTHLGDFTLGEIASIKLRTRRPAGAAYNFAVLVYTRADGTDDDASWYGRRLHAYLDWAASPSAPADTWNTYSTASGTNQLQFWDYRNANVQQGVQPANNFFTLATLQAGPVTPAGVTGARDYRAEKVKFVTLATYSNFPTFEGSLDGLEITLTNGKQLVLDLEQ
ncbi:MAG: hypothetical protein SFX73_34505 [Kofleriaceae bacterium]|nr:hypothetical protein [Kofleriaceae bacterium]